MKYTTSKAQRTEGFLFFTSCLAMTLATVISDPRISLWHPQSCQESSYNFFVCNTADKFSVKSTILFVSLIPSFSSSFYLSLLSFLTCSLLSGASLKSLLTFMLTLLSQGYSSCPLSSFHTSATPDGCNGVSFSICSKAERIGWEFTKSAENEEEYLKKNPEKNGERSH